MSIISNDNETNSKTMQEEKTKEDDTMNATTIYTERPCTIKESIIQSCKEVKSMREGETPLLNIEDLFVNIERWKEEAQRED